MSTDSYYSRLLALVVQPELHAAPDPQLAARLTPQTDSHYVPPAARVDDMEIAGPHGPIPLRVFRPTDERGDRSAVVWCHGGGWIGGSLDSPESEQVGRELAARGCTVVSVGYRLAVDGVHYPVPLNDLVAAYGWAVDSAAALGVDEDRIAVGGASAGANLAAGASLRLRDEAGAHQPHALVLVYPSVHAHTPPPSAELAGKIARLSPMWSFAPEVLTPTIENYLGGPIDTAPAYAMPGGHDVRDLPPTLIVNCEYDGLRASGEAFARELAEADVPVRVMCVPDVAHGHLDAPWTRETQLTFRWMAEWVIKRRTAAAMVAGS